jgi:site-specific DNA-cytosine methylase
MSKTVIDLFCGCGGFSEGFRQAGFKIILGIDIWMDALKSFKINQKCDVLRMDIKDVNLLPECDVIIGSPPCVNFSSINLKREEEIGLVLIHEFERIIKINNPTIWIWENVPSVKKYYPSASILNSWNFGLPQKRKRAFVSNFSFFRMKYEKGKDTKLYGYDGHRASNEGEYGWKHHCKSGTVRTKRIRDIETDKFLSINKVKELMGFPKSYKLYGNITSQQKQLGNAVCPPVAKEIALSILL